MRIRVCQGLAGQKAQHPNQPRLLGRIAPQRIRIAPGRSFYARQLEMRGVGRQVRQSRALHIDEGVFPRGVHALQNKFAPVAYTQVKIAVILAWQFQRACRNSVQLTRQPLCI
jgi:hypothetical protein